MTDEEIVRTDPSVLLTLHPNIRCRARRLGLAVQKFKAGPKVGYKQTADHIAKRRRRAKTALERFQALYIPVTETGCWIWMGSTNPQGYGRFNPKGVLVQAHRFSYEQSKGPIPDGRPLDHLCRVRLCVNPAHLEAVDHRTNILRGDGPAAKHARKLCCKHGHSLDDARRTKEGHRVCRMCERGRKRVRKVHAHIFDP